MKKLIFLVVILLLLPACSVSAHRMGLPIVQINGVWAPGNPIVNYVSNNDLTIAADLAPETYVAGSSINFSMNKSFQRAAGGENMKFRWDFGDKTSLTEGPSQLHAFSKPGTYVVNVSFKYPNEASFYPSDNILIHVVPSTGYTLPRAEISVNQKHMPNTQRSAAPYDFDKNILFDGSLSTGQELKYHWDFGDGAKSDSVKTNHAFKKSDQPTYVTILRVTDKNNISSDSAVFLTERSVNRDTENTVETPAQTKSAPDKTNFIQKIVDFFKNLFRMK